MQDTIEDKGLIKECLVPQILLGFAKSSKTGILAFQCPSKIKKVYLNKGKPVFVYSSCKKESLKEYLIESQILRRSEADEYIIDSNLNELQQIDGLIQRKVIDAVSIAELVVDLNEARLLEIFSWQNGEYYLEPIDQWPSSIPVLPIPFYKTIFKGVCEKIPINIIEDELNISEQSEFALVEIPINSRILPKKLITFLNFLKNSKEIREVRNTLDIPEEMLLRILFMVTSCGWVQVRERAGKSRESSPQFRGSLEELFDMEKRLSLYDLLGFETGGLLHALDQNFQNKLELLDAYSHKITDHSPEKEKIKLLLSWYQLAYFTISTPEMHQLYCSRSDLWKTANIEETEKTKQADRLFMESIFKYHQGYLDESGEKLIEILKIFPNDPLSLAYLALVKHKQDSEKNYLEVKALVHQALQADHKNPHLLYVCGRILTQRKKPDAARKCFLQAIELAPDMKKARLALDRLEYTRKLDF